MLKKTTIIMTLVLMLFSLGACKKSKENPYEKGLLTVEDLENIRDFENSFPAQLSKEIVSQISKTIIFAESLLVEDPSERIFLTEEDVCIVNYYGTYNSRIAIRGYRRGDLIYQGMKKVTVGGVIFLYTPPFIMIWEPK